MTNAELVQAGTVLPSRAHRVDQALITHYAKVSGDHNPLHTDPDFAATTHFGRTIAHGMMTLAFLSDALESWAGAAWPDGGSVDLAFLSPVYPGEEVTVLGTVTDIGDDGKVSCAVACMVGERKIVAGTACWPANADGAGA